MSATNVEPGDNITLSVEGGQTNAGEYIATAVLSGPAADKYELPKDPTHSFVIKKAPAPQITYPSASVLKYGQTLSNSMLTGGSEQYGSFFWKDETIVPTVKNSGYPVRFVPCERAQKNYEQLLPSEKTFSIEVQKSEPEATVNADVKRIEDTVTVSLSAVLSPVGAGEIPAGTVTFEVTGENGEIAIEGAANAVLENGKATVVWNNAESGKCSVKIHCSGNDNYHPVSSAAILLDTQKQSQDSFDILPIGPKTYGDDAFVLKEVGGSGTGAVTFESSNPDLVSIEGNTAFIRKAGTVTITAVKEGDDTYNVAEAFISVKVNRKDLTVLPENTNVPGDYEIFIQGGSLTNAESYTVTYVNGTLSIQKKVIRPEPTTAPEPTSTPVSTPEPTIEPTETSTPAPTVEPTVNPLPMPTEKPTEGVVQYPAVKSETVVKPDWKTVEKENTEESVQAESSDSTDTSEAAEAPESMPTETQPQPENTTKPANIQGVRTY